MLNPKNELLLKQSVEQLENQSNKLSQHFENVLKQLTHKNVQLSEILVQVTSKEKDEVKESTNKANKIIQSCMELRDSFLVLDVLEKKSYLLKQLTANMLK